MFLFIFTLFYILRGKVLFYFQRKRVALAGLELTMQVAVSLELTAILLPPSLAH